MDFTNLKADLAPAKYGAMNEKNFTGARFLLCAVAGDGELTLRYPLEARFYCTASGVVYCWAWVRLPGGYGVGTGRVYGWGYDKESAALMSALVDAGVEFSQEENFHAAGMDTAMSIMQTGLEQELGVKLCQLYAHA